MPPWWRFNEVRESRQNADAAVTARHRIWVGFLFFLLFSSTRPAQHSTTQRSTPPVPHAENTPRSRTFSVIAHTIKRPNVSPNCPPTAPNRPLPVPKFHNRAVMTSCIFFKLAYVLRAKTGLLPQAARQRLRARDTAAPVGERPRPARAPERAALRGELRGWFTRDDADTGARGVTSASSVVRGERRAGCHRGISASCVARGKRGASCRRPARGVSWWGGSGEWAG